MHHELKYTSVSPLYTVIAHTYLSYFIYLQVGLEYTGIMEATSTPRVVDVRVHLNCMLQSHESSTFFLIYITHNDLA
jgi:hypothetical protein